MSDRIQFLQSFLRALGADRISVSSEERDWITGTVMYDPSDPEERQDFTWFAAEKDVPSQPVRQLVDLLYTNRLLDIDKISISRDELRHRYNARYGTALDAQQFDDIMDGMMKVQVRMVDNGEETDVFFIHE